jgi:adenylate cyclase, class 2
MQDEVEVRFLGVNYDGLREILREAGAQQEHKMQSMKCVIIDYPDQRLQKEKSGWAFIRLRDEGDRVILTYKLFSEKEQSTAREIELEVSSYDKTIEFFEAIGLQIISEQHTRRELWELDGCKVTFDEWPWLPPLLEIEGPDEELIEKVAVRLGLDWEKRIYGNVVTAYRMIYPGMTEHDSVREVPKLTFEEMPQWLKDRQRT